MASKDLKVIRQAVAGRCAAKGAVMLSKLRGQRAIKEGFGESTMHSAGGHTANRITLSGALRHSATMAVAGFGFALLGACSGPPTSPALDAARPEGDLRPPVIISSNPARDRVAFEAGGDELSDADWQVLEQYGPKAIWQQISGSRTRRPRPPTSQPAVEPASARSKHGRGHLLRTHEDANTHTAMAAQPAIITSPAAITTPSIESTVPATATTQPATIQPITVQAPTTQPIAAPPITTQSPGLHIVATVLPATRPAAAITALPTATAPAAALTTPQIQDLAEADLPVEIVDLPGNRVRIIWVLRSYGGSNVTTTRDGGTSRRTVAIASPDLAPLVSVVSPSLGVGGSVTALPRENTLVITCDRSMRDGVVDLLSKLDVPARQVEITARIFEVSQDFDFQQGTNLLLNRLANDNGQSLSSTFSARRFLDAVAGGPAGPAGSAAPVQGSVLRLVQAFSSAGISADISLQLLAESGLVRVVSAPRMTVSVGQTGYMLAGQELPIQSANFVNNVLQTATSYKPVGVQLYITPQAAGPEWVKLHTISIVSSISGFSPLPTMDGTDTPRILINPIIDSREAETEVTVGNGDTLVISGLRMVRTATRENKVPGLGDLPLLGWAFKNHRSQQQMTDLYFFLTPVMIDPAPAAVAALPTGGP